MDLKDIMAPLEVIFKQRVANLMKQGDKGTVLFCKKNEALPEPDVYKVTTFNSAIFELDDVNYGENYKDIELQIKQIFNGGTKTVILLQYKTTIASVINVITKQLKWNWAFSTDKEAQADIAALGKEQKKLVLTYNQKADNMYVCSVNNPSAVLANGVKINGSSNITEEQLLPIVIGVCAGCPYDKSISYKTFTELESVELPEEIEEGQITLYNEEEGVRVASPVNTLTTVGEDQTEDMKSIDIVEGMVRIDEDFKYTFRTGYKGKYKNRYDNQNLFFSAAKYYISQLEDIGILDPEYDNTIDVDVEEQRALWKAQGKDADSWDELTVKKTTYKNLVLPLLDIKMLNAMEGMRMRIEMF